MSNRLIGRCPICQEELVVTEVKCKKCGTVIKGEFALSPFDKLTEPEMKFALVFIKNGGNIKGIEKELNISYPTVKKFLDEIISSLGFESGGVTISEGETRQDILNLLRDGKIGFEEAESRLKDIGEKI